MIRVGIAMALLAGGAAAAVAQTTPPVKTAAGPVTGVVTGDVAAYKGMQASRGTYNVQGTTFVRRHIADTDPNVEGKLSSGTFTQQGSTFTWQGTDAAGQKFSATYTKLPPFDVYAPLAARGGGAARGAGPAPARGSAAPPARGQ